MLNSKGTAGTVSFMMVLAALALTVTALYTFASYKGEVAETKTELRKLSFDTEYNIKFLDSILEQIVFKSINEAKPDQNFKEKFEERLKINANSERSANANNNLFGKLANGDFAVDIVGGEYLLRVNGIEMKREFEKHEIIYRFNLIVRFDKDKVIEIERKGIRQDL